MNLWAGVAPDDGPARPRSGVGAQEGQRLRGALAAMKTLDVRRHSVRTVPEEHLSPAGLELAEEVGRSSGTYQLTVSSPLPRAVETAQAMGFPPGRTEGVWASFGDGVDARALWPGPFSAYARALEAGGPTALAAARLTGAARQIVEETPDGGASLIVTHGGLPELLAVALFPTRDPLAWGGPLRCLEGIRVGFEAGQARRIAILRLPPDRTRL